jgi:hypothetical protein
MRRVLVALLWVGAIVLGAFGIYFSFTNYPAFGAAVVLVILLGLGYSERRRRTRQRESERARRKNRARSHDLLDG